MVIRLVAAALLGMAAVAVAIVPGTAHAGTTTVPRPDHVVIVVDENHAAPSVIGNPDAPWITALAAANASFTQSYAVTHPSQPNYLALFSGDTQGVTDDTCPHTFTTPNLADQLGAAGLGFTGWSEDLPSAGWTGCGSGGYVAKHAPWVNWPSVPAVAHQPFSAFPTDFSTLPAVSIVVPNLQHDMHDGTIAQGDAWLQSTMSGYVEWAKTHNSLFVLTFDEDDFTTANRIPTIMAGARVTPGTYDGRIDHYSLLRTLEDAYGLPPLAHAAQAAPFLEVWSAPTGTAPTASFTATCTGASCTVDGSASTDPDGTALSWSWAFGDGTTASGPTASHTYAVGGAYTVTLTVTDGTAATGTARRTVSVTDPPGAAFASDTFARTVTGGWGTADVGGAWSVTQPAAFGVTGGAGTIRQTKAGATLTATLGGAARSDTDLTTDLRVDQLPNGTAYVYVTGRNVAGAGNYHATIRWSSTGAVTMSLTRTTGSTSTDIVPVRAVAGATVTPGAPVHVRLQVTGTNPTTVQAKVWTSATEPGTWAMTVTDATAALQAAGSTALAFYLNSATTTLPMTLSATSWTARSLSAPPPPPPPPPNQPPTAAFAASCTDLACTVDGGGSSDPDGRVAGWAWSFGDGGTATGATAAHTYAAGGTYTVTLTVTDDGGATATTTRTVTPVTPPPPPPPPPPPTTFAADAFGRTVTGGWGTADVGGRWTTTGSAANISVTPGAGVLRMPTAGTTVGAWLPVSTTDADVLTTVALDKVPTGNGVYLTVTPRRVSSTAEYQVTARLTGAGTVGLTINRLAGGVGTALTPITTVPGLTYAAGTVLAVRVEAVGTAPTTLRARVWVNGTAEPTTWAATATDATAAFQAPGGIGMTTYLSSSSTSAPVVARVSGLTGRSTTTP